MRAKLRQVVSSPARQDVLANAAVYVYLPGTSTEVGLHDAASGGNAVAQPLLTNDQGEAEAYVDFGVAKVDLLVTSNGGAAYLASNPTAVQSFASFVEPFVLPAAEYPDGLWLPSPTWGDNWRAARAAAGARLVNVVGWGDSIMQGYYSSDFRATAWFAVLIAALQAASGDGGSGFLSVVNTTGIGATGATYMTKTGTWDSFAATINEFTIFPHTDATGTLTVAGIRGRYIDLWNVVGSVLTAFTYVLDGGAPVTVSIGAGTADLVKTTIDTGSAGPHTLVITPTVSKPIFAGVTGRNATGIVGHNMGVAGRSSGAGGTTTWLTGGKTARDVSITDFAPDLFVLSMGTNDIAGSVSADTYLVNLYKLLKAARAYGDGVADIVVVTDHFGLYPDAGLIAPRYATQARDIAESFGAAWLNRWALGRNSWDYFDGLGYWGITGGATGAAGTDVVHPSDGGMAAYAAALIELLAP